MKSITIILVYVSRLKEKKKFFLIFLCSHIHKLSFSKTTILFSFLFSLCGTHVFLFTVWHLLFLLVCVLPFSTPHTCLLYIKAFPHTLKSIRSRNLGTSHIVLCKELGLLAIQAYHKLIKE